MYYVAGGYFVEGYNGCIPIYKFGFVRPSQDKPCYITKNSNGLWALKCHSCLYAIKETEQGYVITMVRQISMSKDAPSRVVLNKGTELYNYLQRSIQYAEANNRFYD